MLTRAFAGAFLCATLAAALAAPSALAARAEVSSDGRYLLVTETTPGEVNRVLASLKNVSGTQYVDLIDDVPVEPGPGCSYDAWTGVTRCLDPTDQIRISLGGGNDDFKPTEIGTAITFGDGALALDLGDGNDSYSADDTNAVALVQGGAGDDDLVGGHLRDDLRGGPGDDVIDGANGADQLRGEAGNDTLRGDHPSDHGIFPDLLDGGDGIDLVRDYLYSGDPHHAPPVTIVLDGQANDGRQGEGDNVVAVERIQSSSAGSFIGDEGDNEFRSPQVGPPGTLTGNGGNDRLIAGDAHGDVVDGGHGLDLVEGGFGDDTLTGGPGRDTVNGDRRSNCNEYSCDLFVAGNDTIDVRDGEVDAVTCGTGEDRVTADAADVVADDCETVSRGTVVGPPPPPPPPAKATLSVSRVKLGKALKRGFLVRLVNVSGKVRVEALYRRRPVASGSGTARQGRATVRLRFTAKAKRTLRRKKRISLRVKGAGATRTVVMKSR